jgi:hypothetical protein
MSKIISILFVFLYVNQLYCQTDANLFDYSERNTTPESTNKSNNILKIRINSGLLKNSEEINFVLPGGNKCFVKKTMNYVNENQYNAWSGRIINNDLKSAR